MNSSVLQRERLCVCAAMQLKVLIRWWMDVIETCLSRGVSACKLCRLQP
jgi:hypothetical protein